MSDDLPEDNSLSDPSQQFRLSVIIGGLSVLIISYYLRSLSPHTHLNTFLSISGFVFLILGGHAPTTEKFRTAIQKAARWFQIGPLELLGLVLAILLSLIARSAAGDSKLAHAGSHGAIWLIAILLGTLSTLDHSRTNRLKKVSTTEWLLLSALLISAFILRAYRITEIPFGVTGDEGGTGFTALDYRNGARTNILASGWFQFPSLYYWIVSKSFHIVSGRLLAIRLVSAIGGTLAVGALYFALRQLFSREHAAIGATFLAVNHVHIVFSRGAMNNIWDGLFVMLTIGALWRGWETGNRNAFILAGLSLGFSQYFYTTGHLTPVYILLWIPFLHRKTPIRERLSGMTLMFIIAAIVFLPLGMHYINKPEMLLIPMKRVSILNADWIATTTDATGNSAYQLYAQQLQQTLKGLTQTTVRGLYNPGRPVLLLLDSLLFFIGLGLLAIRLSNPAYIILLLGLIGPILAGTFSVEAPSSQRLLYTVPFLTAFLSISVVELRRQLKSRLPNSLLMPPFLVLVFLSSSAFSNLDFLFTEAMPDHRYSDRGAYFSRALSDFMNAQPDDILTLMIQPAPMGYQSIPSLVYLAPKANWKNIDWYQLELEKLQPGTQKTLFVFQKENVGWSELLVNTFPEATIYTQNDHHNRLLFQIVEVDMAATNFDE
jgi:hypothetical protein